MSFGGIRFHHYNIGSGLLSTIGAIALRGEERHRRHLMTAVAYGSTLALIFDALALLIDLKDVYWARDGRKRSTPPSFWWRQGAPSSPACRSGRTDGTHYAAQRKTPPDAPQPERAIDDPPNGRRDAAAARSCHTGHALSASKASVSLHVSNIEGYLVPGRVWAVDFQFDVTTDGRPIKIVSIITNTRANAWAGWLSAASPASM